MLIYFFNGLSFGGLGLAAYLQIRQGGKLPLSKQLPWLAAFGFACGATSWIDMFLASGSEENYLQLLKNLRLITQPLSGLLLLRFGWGILKGLTPLPPWTIFIPGVLIMPISFAVAYAATTFVTPSPIDIPIDIWSRYLLYLPGSIMAGIGFYRQRNVQRRLGHYDVSNLLLGSAIGFLFEAFVVGLIVPAAPHAPASYYNYDRVVINPFSGELETPTDVNSILPPWLDYEYVLSVTGLPIQFWRMLSSFAVTFFVVRGLGVFEATRRRELRALQEERDRAQRKAFEAQIAARQEAESWTDFLVAINQRLTKLEEVDQILLDICENARQLLRSDFAGLAVLDRDSSDLYLKCFSNWTQSELVPSPLKFNNPLLQKILQSRQSYWTNEGVDGEPLKDFCYPPGTPAQAVAVVRLDFDTHPVGVLWIARFDHRPYTETDLVWLECVADQVVIAIQHGLMTSQLQSLSITEERTRIAREMHDGLAQVLGYLNLQVQTLEALLNQDKHDELRSELAQMRKAVRLAHADIRENILSLRTTLAHEGGLTAAVGEYLDEFGIQNGIDARFENRVTGELDLSSIAEVQLVCIMQEALANVRKHACATRVDVLLERENEGEQSCIVLQVRDDGVGFVQRDSKRRFGLQTMRERAESVQGSLWIESAPGAGTTVICKLPCLKAENSKRYSRVITA